MEPLFTNYEMADGSVIPICLNYGALFQLRSKNKKAYDDYNLAIKSLKDEPEYSSAVLIYTAYLCAALVGEVDDTISQDEFFFAMNQNRNYNNRIAQEIYVPNQKKASAKRS